MDDWITVVPAQGQVKETARALLDLAHSPDDVRTIRNGSEFTVPPYLAELYNPTTAPTPKRRRSKKEEVTDDGS